VLVAEIVPRREQREHQLLILPFVAEGVRQLREKDLPHSEPRQRNAKVSDPHGPAKKY
jgi:hypothetical protein